MRKYDSVERFNHFFADAAIKQMILAGKSPKNSKVVILGLTFKENCPDTRNTKIIDIYNIILLPPSL